MKIYAMKKVFFTFVIIVLAMSLDCQPAKNDIEFDNGSNIIFPELDRQTIDNLELLGKLWGFLKYHHPEIGKGNYNWDYELFRILPEYLQVTDKKQRDQVLISWINKYGKIPACKSCQKTSDNAYLKPNLTWLEDSDVGKILKNKVKEIYQNRHQGKHYYISMALSVGNPKFLNENEYSNMSYPDQGFRLLALYRFWSTIQYFYPYKYLTDTDWDIILKEYIPKFLEASNGLEYELVALQLIGEINDTHAGVGLRWQKVGESRGYRFAPFRVQFIENELIVTEYFNPELQEISKLQVGDIITHIAGKSVGKIIDSLKIYYPASNDASQKRDIAFNILRSSQPSIEIQYISDSLNKEMTLMLYKSDSLNLFKECTEKSYRILDENIGYITLRTIKNKDIPAIKESLKNTKGIIIDIRNGVSEFVPYTLGSYFVSKSTPFAKSTIGNINNPGEFRFSTIQPISKGKEVYQGKLVVLVNEFTQSMGEFIAMAFRAGENTTIVGTTTAGTDGDVSIISLPGGLKMYISGIGIYYPDGSETQRVGIIPDIYIEPTIEGIKSGRDEVLEKAIEIINK